MTLVKRPLVWVFSLIVLVALVAFLNQRTLTKESQVDSQPGPNTEIQMHHNEPVSPTSFETDNSANPHFLDSKNCALCHSNSDRAIAMRDRKNRPIAPYDLWQASMMANSSRDPYWRAVLSAEVVATPSKKALIEEKCTRCHAPMAAPAPESPKR